MRSHVRDPTSRLEVIRNGASAPEMRWDRWSGWRAGDPRWHVRVVDTSVVPVEDVARELVQWITEERAAFRSGTHPLTAL
jgi:hypothetical protein